MVRWPCRPPEQVDLKGTKNPFVIKIWLILMVYSFNYNNLVSDSIINFFYLILEGESQCITLHLLPVCDIIGQTHILHIHYFLCVFSQSNGINCTFACRNLFITYNYIEHGTFCTMIHFGYFSSCLLVFLFYHMAWEFLN